MTGPSGNGLASLRRFAAQSPAVERCGGCGAPLPEAHEHVLADDDDVRCACGPCAEHGRRVPPRADRLDPGAVPDGVVDALDVPIGLFWLLAPTAARGPLAVWPSPGGPVRAPIAPARWEEAAAASPALAALAPEVEALLVDRLELVRGAGQREVWRVSVDRCHELAGVVRAAWRGLSGGPALRDAVEAFRDRLRAEAS